MNPFESVGVPRVGRTKFNLSFTKLLTCDMGQLIPVACEEVIPGDFWQISNELVIRLMPIVSPMLQEVYATIHWYFVRLPLLWEDWEPFITGGEKGDDVSVAPRWTPTGGNVTNDDGTVVADNAVGSLWDYLGFATGVIPTGALPLDFPRRAYNLIWNDYYRDEWIQDEIALTSSVVKNRAWRKDYLTSALLSQQRGTAPSMALTGTGTAVFPAANIVTGALGGNIVGVGHNNQAGNPTLYGANAAGEANLEAFFAANTIDMSSAGTFDINDLRTLVAVQRWMELNARGGARYIEWIPAHFPGAGPKDDRMDRPEYIGGFRAPVIISEVLQTSKSEAGAPQGNLAGHGILADRQFCGTYRAQEHGVLMGILSVMPSAIYQHGMPRQWLRENRYDWYDPMFAHLSEQAIRKGEVYATNVEAENEAVFGYQGIFDEMRVKQSQVAGKMRTTFDYWHMSRQFAGVQSLNEDFIRCVPRKDVFAAPSEVSMVVHVGNNLLASRLMPARAEPGFVE